MGLHPHLIFTVLHTVGVGVVTTTKKNHYYKNQSSLSLSLALFLSLFVSSSDLPFFSLYLQGRIMRSTTIFSLLLSLSFFHSSNSTTTTNNTIIVDGPVDWKSPTTLHLGDSIVFKHKNLHNLFLFRSRTSFDHCNFTQATLIFTGTSTSFTWTASRPGNYYFATEANCKNGEKVPVRVLTPDLSSKQPAPPPTAGGPISTAPSRGGWGSGWVASSPTSHSSPGSLPASPETAPLLPKEGNPLTPAGAPVSGDGIPFISSNPAVPLPTGMTDTATIQPLPTPGTGNQAVGSGSMVLNGKTVMVSLVVCCALGLWM